MKFFGQIGYNISEEEVDDTGVWIPSVVERSYKGDFIRDDRNLSTTDSVNGNVTFSNQISVISDSYGFLNHVNIRYVRWNGNCWQVSSVEVVRPRILIRFGELYNGPTGSSS